MPGGNIKDLKLLSHDSIREQRRLLGWLLAISMHTSARRRKYSAYFSATNIQTQTRPDPERLGNSIVKALPCPLDPTFMDTGMPQWRHLSSAPG